MARSLTGSIYFDGDLRAAILSAAFVEKFPRALSREFFSSRMMLHGSYMRMLRRQVPGEHLNCRECEGKRKDG